MKKLLMAVLMLNLAVFSGNLLAQGGHGKADEKSQGKGHGYGHTKDHASATGLANGRGHYGHHECVAEELVGVVEDDTYFEEGLLELRVIGTLCASDVPITTDQLEEIDGTNFLPTDLIPLSDRVDWFCDEQLSNDSVVSDDGDSASVDILYECGYNPPA